MGDQISTAGGRSSTQFDGGAQRFIRIPNDGDTIWVVSNTFFDMEPKPESWLDKDFFDVQKIKEVTVTPTEAVEGWKVGRPDEVTQEFKLLDAKVGEGLDGSKLTLTSLLSTPTFNDVVPKDKTEEVMKGAVSAKILTFDGFTYDVKVAKQSKDGSDRYYISFTVSADIPKERPPVKDEKEEDKKKADEAFASRKKAQEEKLAKEQKFVGWAFEVSEYTVNNLFKKRSEIVKVEAKSEPVPAPEAPAAPTPAPAPATSSAAAPAIPELNPKQVSVTTPPVQAPAPAKPDIKPAPAADAVPVVEEKK